MIFRKVVNLNYVGACQYTGYKNRTAELVLECGHTNCRKASVALPSRARCRECEYAEYQKAHATTEVES